MWQIIILGVIGGMGLLLYGMAIMSDNLQRIAGAKLRRILTSLTNNRISGLFVGIIVTVLFQSSTATTVILVGLTSASIISFKQTLSVILGSNIGTTITAQLIALNITEISLAIVGLGATVVFFSKKDKYVRWGQILMGFGLVFLGLKMMSEAMVPLQESTFVLEFMSQIGNNPWLAMLVALVFTSLIHNSAAAVGIIMVMAAQNLIDLHAAMYLLFGANIGTAFTAILTSLGASREAKRVAMANLLYKVIGVLLFLPFVKPLEALLVNMTISPMYQVANAHTVFNIVISLLFLPFISLFAIFMEKILPDKQNETAIKPRYLDQSLIKTPSIALGLATKEIVRLCDDILDMTKSIATIFEKNDESLLEQVNQTEDKVDILYQDISKYLTALLRQPLSRIEFTKCIGLINIVNDLEHIGDIIEKNVTYLAKSKMKDHYNFSHEGWDEIVVLHRQVCELIHMVRIALLTEDKEMALEAMDTQKDIETMERRLRVLHIHRLKIGMQKSEISSSTHLDLINALLQISIHTKNIAMEIAEEQLTVKTPEPEPDSVNIPSFGEK